ncbi:MAG: PQQ-binding-like beta-propeller repeat protein [Pirellulales bacterium]
MSAAANKLLDRIEQLGLLEDGVVAELRRKVADSRSAVAPETIVKLLVDKGHITTFQAKKLLADAGGDDGGSKPAAKPAKPAAPADDDLGLATLDDEPAPAPPAAKPAAEKPAEKPSSAPEKDAAKPAKGSKPAAKPTPGLTPVATPGLTPVATPGLTPVGTPGLTPVATPGLTPVATPGLTPLGAGGLTPVDGGLTPIAAPGLTPVGPPGLTPVAGAGLTPLDAGLVPVDAGGGMTSADPFAGGLGGALVPPGPSPAAAAAAASFKKVRRKGWDSPLMLLGGGGLILLLLSGFVLVYILIRGDAKDILDAANADYQAQSYTQAIAKYEKFLKNFPKDPNASFARVRHGLAQLRSVVEGTRELKAALSKAQEIIPKIENEERFGDARPELAGILPDIALGLSQQAKNLGATPEAEELVGLADQALEMVRNPSYIPTSLRTSQQQRIDEIERVLGEAKRGIEQEKALVAALQDIAAAANAGQTPEAFERRRSLLKLYPAVEADPRLAQAVRDVAAREQQLVRVEAMPLAAVAEDHPELEDVRRVLISHRRGSAAPGAENHVLFFLASGAVHGLDATSGQLLWRRTVGYETRQHPLPVSKEPGADAILVDGARQELVRVAARTGKAVWRLPVGERFANPVLAGTRILLATETGQLLEVDVATGESARRVRFPQALPVEPGPWGMSGHTYQAGTHSQIYVLATDTLECREVFYLGHRAGTVVVPPVMALNHLVVAENAGPDYCLLHVLGVDEKGLGVRKPAELEPIRLAGHIVTPLVQVRNRVLAVTSLGEARVVEIDPANKEKPARVIGSLVKTSSQPLPSYALFDYAQLWIGADRFVAYDVQASRGQINRRWIKHELELFVAPLQQLGKTVFHARRRRGSAGISVTAARLEDGVQIWRTDLAVPLTFVGGDTERKQITALSAQGDLFRVAKDALDSGILDQPVESTEVEGSATTFTFHEALPLGGGRLLLVSDTDRASLLVYDPSRMGDELILAKADTGTAAITAMPQVFAGAALVPLDNGRVVLFDPGTGKPRMLPFEPRIEPGLKVRWTRPSVYGGDQPEFVIADNRQRIYRAGIKDTPNPHLEKLAEAELPGTPVAPVAANSDAAYVVLRTAEGDAVHPLVMPDLAAHAPIPLKGRVIQGPWSIENQILLVTDTEGLVAFGSDHTVKWAAPLPAVPLAGAPRIEGDWILAATRSGVVLRLALADGTAGGSRPLQAPLFSPPASYGSRLLVGGSDGAFYALPGLMAP